MSKEMHPTPQEYFDSIKTDKMAIITLKQLCAEFLNIDVDPDIIREIDCIINTIGKQLDKSKDLYPYIKDKFTFTNYVYDDGICYNCYDGEAKLSCIINNILHIEVKKTYDEAYHAYRHLITISTEHISVVTKCYNYTFNGSTDNSKIDAIIQLLNDKMLSGEDNKLDEITVAEFMCMLKAFVMAS